MTEGTNSGDVPPGDPGDVAPVEPDGTPDFDVAALIAATRPSATDLALSPDGRRLVIAAATANPDGSRFVSALYDVPVSGQGRPRRLTHSEKGEASPAFAPDGSLLFTSARERPHADHAEARTGLWRLPPGGEAEPVACPPGGVEAYAVAEQAGVVTVLTGVHREAGDWRADAAIEKARDDGNVTATLLTDFPARHWDRWLAPRQRRLFAADADADPDGDAWHDLDPLAGPALDLTTFALTPDGRTTVAARARDDPDVTARPMDLLAYQRDGTTVRAHTLLAEDDTDHSAPQVSPDGRWVVCVRARRSTPAGPGDHTLALVDLAGGQWRDLLADFDRFPGEPVFTRDSAAVLFCADEHGRRPLFAVDLASATVRRLAADGAYHAPRPAPDGTVYALRATMREPHRVVALDAHTTGQSPASPGPNPGLSRRPNPLPTPGDDLTGPGRIERLVATADDGVEIPAWLILPPAAAHNAKRGAPLALLIHGGPVGSWNEWSWRWQPHVLAARGWAVVLPDPARSTGYGLDFVARGWGRWGAEPCTDVLACVEAAAARDDVDADRVAALGGSFGGYLANWLAGHTDRFAAIVSHASLWDLEAFHATTDHGPLWEREFGDPYADASRYREWSPRRAIGDITTPMLVIHGTKDYRVPESQGLALWTDLQRHGVESAYLAFPDEHHWVVTPAHSRVWYDTVIAWLDHYVLGRPWRRPPPV